ncbi:N-6 DNA methylase [Streptosporangium canum]|uniref:N-6 DNA methylase n=1 Tax=Streptosporangium canum TaxID=324952 RepID=UPI003449FA8C
MTTSGKPTTAPKSPYGPSNAPLHVSGQWIWAPLRGQWLIAKPEERVRQQFIYDLHTSWGYSLGQMRQEVKTQRGRGSARADIVISESSDDLSANRNYRIVVEAKAENVSINVNDYDQGESYARSVGAEFLVMHNMRETAYLRLIPGAPGERIEITTIPKADELGDAKRLAEIRRSTKAFTRDEFQRLLFDCHCILRDNHKMDPGAAFDEISKILFIKMAYERMDRTEVFSVDTLDNFAKTNLIKDDTRVLQQIFTATENYYKADALFGEDERLRISLETFRRIVGKLQKFNLSNTGDDVKGIAFERFLGQTFRGELGQFFTPRPIVEFMVEMLDPQEGELICDPAAGTGGFLIKVFEHLKEKVERDVHDLMAAEEERLDRLAIDESWSEERHARELEQMQSDFSKQVDQMDESSRLFRIAHESIYGVDAEPRAARTSKMNMIMHGDGHGGIYYHDGLIDTAGVFEGRFHVVVTNPPFGANVGADQIVGATEQTRIDSPSKVAEYKRLYGPPYAESHARLLNAQSKKMPVLQLFDIGRDPIAAPDDVSRVRKNRPTETLFVERCLRLLHPGGRMGIVLPDGILNNPSLAWLREYVEERAKLQAVISIPQDVFASSKATVKTSLVFLRKFTDEESQEWRQTWTEVQGAIQEELAGRFEEVDSLHRRSNIYDREELAVLIDEIDDIEVTLSRSASKTTATGKRLRELKGSLRMAVTPADRERARELRREATARQVELEREVQRVTRMRTREALSYPVFMAEVGQAGITATGETGTHVLNELPEIRAAYKRFLNDKDLFLEESQRVLRESMSITGDEA